MQFSGEAQRAQSRASGWTNGNDGNDHNGNDHSDGSISAVVNVVNSRMREWPRENLGLCSLCDVPLTGVSTPRRHDSIFHLDCAQHECNFKLCIHCATYTYLEDGMRRYISVSGAEVNDIGYANGNLCSVKCPHCRQPTHTSPLWHVPFCGREGIDRLLAKINGENMEGLGKRRKNQCRTVIRDYARFRANSVIWERLGGSSDVGGRMHGCVFPSSSGAPYELNEIWSKQRIFTYEECAFLREQDADRRLRARRERIASESITVVHEHIDSNENPSEERVVVSDEHVDDTSTPEVQVDIIDELSTSTPVEDPPLEQVASDDASSIESEAEVEHPLLEIPVQDVGIRQRHPLSQQQSEMIELRLASLPTQIAHPRELDEDERSVSSSVMNAMENGIARVRAGITPCTDRVGPAVALISQGVFQSGIVDDGDRFEMNHLLIQIILSVPTYFWLPFSLIAFIPMICYVVSRATHFYGEWREVTSLHDVSHVPSDGEGEPNPGEIKEILMYTRYSQLTRCRTIVSRWLIANFLLYVIVILYRLWTYNFQDEFSYDYPFFYFTMSNVMLLITLCRHFMTARHRYAGILQYPSEYLFGFPVIMTKLYSIPDYEGVVSVQVYINSVRTIFARVRAGNLDHDALHRYISMDLGKEVGGDTVDPIVLENSVAVLRQWIIVRNLIHPTSIKGGVSNVNY